METICALREVRSALKSRVGGRGGARFLLAAVVEESVAASGNSKGARGKGKEPKTGRLGPARGRGGEKSSPGRVGERSSPGRGWREVGSGRVGPTKGRFRSGRGGLERARIFSRGPLALPAKKFRSAIDAERNEPSSKTSYRGQSSWLRNSWLRNNKHATPRAKTLSTRTPKTDLRRRS